MAQTHAVPLAEGPTMFLSFARQTQESGHMTIQQLGVYGKTEHKA